MLKRLRSILSIHCRSWWRPNQRLKPRSLQAIAAGDRQKAAEPEAKKPVRSSMVTAKFALMADPRLFPHDIEVDAWR